MNKADLKQLKKIIGKQKKIVAYAQTDWERTIALAFLASFLTGLRMSRAIAKEEYEVLYSDMRDFKSKFTELE